MIESNDLKIILFWLLRRFWSRSTTTWEPTIHCRETLIEFDKNTYHKSYVLH